MFEKPKSEVDKVVDGLKGSGEEKKGAKEAKQEVKEDL